MKVLANQLLLSLLLIYLSACNHSSAQSSKESIRTIDAFEWENRIILIHAQTACIEAESNLRKATNEIDERHVLWFVFCDSEIKTNFSGRLSDAFSNQTLGTFFSKTANTVILIGKDGGVKYRAKTLDLLEIYQRIDSMPMRQSEMREQGNY